VSDVCKFCGATMARIIGHHLRRCIIATDEERSFYERHRQWPPLASGYVSSSEVGATLAQRVGVLERAVDLLMDTHVATRVPRAVRKRRGAA
jgi:hypothetical protein